MFKTKRVLPLLGALALSGALAGPASAQGQEMPTLTVDFARALGTIKMMDAMDSNKDHKVTKQEFMAYFDKMWAMMDKEKKGYVTETQWVPFFTNLQSGG
jgi:hypothetical protein